MHSIDRCESREDSLIAFCFSSMSSKIDLTGEIGEGFMFLRLAPDLNEEEVSSKHHTLATETKNIPSDGFLRFIDGRLCIREDNGTFVQLLLATVVSVNGKRYAVLPGKTKFERSLEASHFRLAIAEAEFLGGGLVTMWTPLQVAYSFDFFTKVLFKKIRHFFSYGVVLENGGAIEEDGVIQCGPDEDRKDTVWCCVETPLREFSTERRAVSAVMGSIEDLFFQPQQDGLSLNLSPHYTAHYSRSGDQSLRKTMTVSVIQESCIVRCGKYVGPSLEGSDGYCGPDNGPACPSCVEKQSSIGKKFSMQVTVSNTGPRTNVFIKVGKVPSPDVGEASGKRQREEATRGTCVICMDAPSTHAATPCGHRCLCVGCSSSFRAGSNCPMCRKKVDGWLQIYDA